jgi:uncharacterized protein YegP (UPF0339 family)
MIAATLLGLTCTACLHAQPKAPINPVVGSVEIVKVKDGEFRYRIKNIAGNTIAASPEQMVLEKNDDVQKVLKEILTILKASAPAEDPESKAQFKDKESAYSYRIKNSKGVIIAAPPADLHWKSRAEVLAVYLQLKLILQTTTPIEVPLHPQLIGREISGDSAEK